MAAHQILCRRWACEIALKSAVEHDPSRFIWAPLFVGYFLKLGVKCLIKFSYLSAHARRAWTSGSLWQDRLGLFSELSERSELEAFSELKGALSPRGALKRKGA